MNALNPWLDADKVRSVSQQLMAATENAPNSVAEVGFDDTFVGFTLADAPVLTEREVFLAQLPKFQQWLVSEFSAKGVFLVDQEGDSVFDKSGQTRLHFMARSLMVSSKTTGSCPSHVRLRISSDRILELIPAETPALGKFVIGVLVPQALSSEAVQAVVAAARGGDHRSP
jgi:hypothetical protein